MSLEPWECEIVFMLAEGITGTHQQGSFRKDILISNVERRIAVTNSQNISEYLKLINIDKKEYTHFISAITIHTTSWFREKPHYNFLISYIKQHYELFEHEPFHAWSAACSTGEELYTLGLCFEKIKKDIPTFRYNLFGTDLDPVSVQKANKAIFNMDELTQIPEFYRDLILQGTGKVSSYFTIDKNVRTQTQFEVRSLDTSSPYKQPQLFNVIFCRNVLIYFNAEKIKKIINMLISSLKPGGILILGHSEVLTEKYSELTFVQGSVYRKNEQTIAQQQQQNLHLNKNQQTIEQKRKILIVDDSPTVRLGLKKLLNKNNYLIVEADSAESATDCLKATQFDLITLDLNMPGENGSKWLTRKRREGLKTPVIIVSDSSPREAEKVIGALNKTGAQEYITKSRLSSEPQFLIDVSKALIEKKNYNSEFNKKVQKDKILKDKPSCILIGASTGGPETLCHLLDNFPKPCPPVVVVQHINSEYSKAFADRLSQVSGLQLCTGQADEELKNNTIYLSLGNYHIGIESKRSTLTIKHDTRPKVNGHCPSVDYLFESATHSKKTVVAIILTGMGQDGASGISALHALGNNFTMAQDEESCVVFGMPKVAIEKGAIDFIGNIPQIRTKLIDIISKEHSRKNIAVA